MEIKIAVIVTAAFVSYPHGHSSCGCPSMIKQGQRTGAALTNLIRKAERDQECAEQRERERVHGEFEGGRGGRGGRGRGSCWRVGQHAGWPRRGRGGEAKGPGVDGGGWRRERATDPAVLEDRSCGGRRLE